MSDSYKRVRRIGTAGLTLTEGTFSGFINPSGIQTITYAGVRHQDINGNYGGGITMTVNAGALVPIKCEYLRPATSYVLGLFD